MSPLRIHIHIQDSPYSFKILLQPGELIGCPLIDIRSLAKN
jgi:hypothetical protein